MQNEKLFENTPANAFEDAHLLGNGSLGVSVFGGVSHEKLLINHDTLWSGQENDKISKNTLPNFATARKLTLEGKIKEATELINNEMLGNWSEAFLPLGYLHLMVGNSTDIRSQAQRRIFLEEHPVSNYRRTLLLNQAVEKIEYETMDTRYTREMFVSRPDNVLAVRLTAQKKPLNFSFSMDSPLRHEQVVADHGVGIFGRAPDRVECYTPTYSPEVVYHTDCTSDSIRFAAAAKVVETDGTISADAFRTYVTNASYAVILMNAGTNYTGFRQLRQKDARLVLQSCHRIVEAAAKKGYEKLLADHIADYRSLYGRFEICLGEPITEVLPTSERLVRMQSVDDPAMIALVAQYVRYLLISFSRTGTQAGNLQGIWNPNVQPEWACNYTTNINVQMNYWPAEPLNLSECHEPMMDLVRECAQAGEVAAQNLYGLPGWVTHHNTDLWRFSALAGEDASWAWWPFGGAWMCAHLWQHFEYTRDKTFLKETVYPVLRGAAEFLCAFVVKDANGHYVTAPSTSPENKFFLPGAGMKAVLEEVDAQNRFSPNRPDVAEVCKAATMDLAIIRELLCNLKCAIIQLDEADCILPKLEEVLQNLLPFQIGKFGTLQEWDRDYEECTPGMGHVSHLYTVYPSEVINESQPALYEAAYQSLLRRTQHAGAMTDWPAAWKLCLFARFQDGAQCNRLNALIASNLTANMLLKGFLQIDAIMGWGAGIAEMLLQSHGGKIRLLPALAPSWRTGKIKGMCARGGVQVDMQWEKAKLIHAVFTAASDQTVCVAYGEKEAVLRLTAGVPTKIDSLLAEMKG